MSGTEVRTTQVTYDKAGKLDVTCGASATQGVVVVAGGRATA
jgi:hypothetical protein